MDTADIEISNAIKRGVIDAAISGSTLGIVWGAKPRNPAVPAISWPSTGFAR